jgi:hypothetical protein
VSSLFLNATIPPDFWNSPALQIFNGDAKNTDGATPVLDLPSNAHQFLRVTAGNDGASAMNVHVQMWAMAFAAAAAPSMYLASFAGTTGVTVPSGTGPAVGASPVPFDSPNWLPKSTDADIISHSVGGEVHCCMQANVYGPGDGASVNDPFTELHPATNRHHAQRNMTIKQHTPGARIDFEMFVANPVLKSKQQAILQVREQDPRRVPPWQVQELATTVPWIEPTRAAGPKGGGVTNAVPGTVPGGLPGVEVVVDGKRRPLLLPQRPLGDLGLEVGGKGGANLTLLLAPDHPQPMRLNATLPGQEFALRVLDITQVQGDKLIGGARVLLVTAPGQLLAKPRAFAEAKS